MNSLTADQYVESVLAKYAVQMGANSEPERVANTIAPTIRQWAGSYLASLSFSGSYAKGTPVHGGTDVDLFISLNPNTPESLRQIYESLHALAVRNMWSPRRQDVSIGISTRNLTVDLVPGKIQGGYQNYHSLYRSKTDSWTQTNVALHVSTIRDSQRTKEIRAIKIWRNLHRLDFSSFYLELTVLEGLKGRATNTLSANVLHALRYIATSLPSARVVDPANTNNVISNDLAAQAKSTIANQASVSASKANWGQIIW
jgi:hypothetical protein